MTYVLLALVPLIGLYWPVNWVRVEFSDERGQPQTAFFTDASFAGRWQGGARRLCSLLQQRLGPDPASSSR